MKTRLLVAVAALCGMAATTTTTAAPIGTADSTARYTVVRPAERLAVPPDAVSNLRSGDGIQSADAMVRVRGFDGATFLLAPESEAHFPAPARMELLGGSAGLSMRAGDQAITVLNYRDLHLDLLPAADGAQGMLTVVTNDGNVVEVAAVGSAFAAIDSDTGQGIAVVGDGDHWRFVRDQAGDWTAVVPAVGGPLDFLRAQVEGDTDGAETSVDEDEEERRAAFFWRWWPAGAAGAGAAAAVGVGVVVAGGGGGGGGGGDDRPVTSPIVVSPPDNGGGDDDDDFDHGDDDYYDDDGPIAVRVSDRF